MTHYVKLILPNGADNIMQTVVVVVVVVVVAVVVVMVGVVVAIAMVLRFVVAVLLQRSSFIGV